jgi:hypothetical protein
MLSKDKVECCSLGVSQFQRWMLPGVSGVLINVWLLLPGLRRDFSSSMNFYALFTDAFWPPVVETEPAP